MKKIYHVFKAGFIIAALLCVTSALAAMHNSSSPADQNPASPGRNLLTTAGELDQYPDSYIAVGGIVNLKDGTPGDMLVLAGQTNVSGEVGRFAVASAGKIDFGAKVAKRTILFGGDIKSRADSWMYSGGYIIGGDIDLAGNSNKDITVIGGTVDVSGTYNGNVNIVAGRLSIKPNTVIAGKLNYLSAGSVNISKQATISGGAAEVMPHTVGMWQAKHSGFHFGYWILQVVQLLIVLLALNAVCRRTAPCVASKLAARPLASFGTGLLVIIVGLLLAPVLLVTVIGSYLALLWGLVYVLLLLLGYLYFAQSVGLLILSKVKKTGKSECASEEGSLCCWTVLWSSLLGLIVVTLLAMIPVVGKWLSFIFVIFGVGALVRMCCKKRCGKNKKGFCGSGVCSCCGQTNCQCSKAGNKEGCCP